MMGKKGQSSIEFILLVSIALIYISGVVMPASMVSRHSTEDLMQLAQARLAAEKLANSIDAIAASSGEAKMTISILLPARAMIICHDPTIPPYDGIDFNFWLTMDSSTPLLENTGACPHDSTGKSVCTKRFKTMETFDCINKSGLSNPIVGDPSVMNSSTLITVTIQKRAIIGGDAIDVIFG
jgi:hypothetical protein